jgi:glycosyltransferase involved in cell wall biosynthesis
MLLNLFKIKKQKGSGLLVVGHDLKFLSPVLEHYYQKNEFKLEKYSYQGHVIPDKNELLRILPNFKVIFCEWGLGNIQFLSKNKKPWQKLIVRIHLQEFTTCFLRETHWDNVDAIILISDFQLERFKKMFPEHAHKCLLIYNLIDCNDLNREKAPEALYTLGMMGILPMRKWPHLGVEILHELKKHDQRYKLSIKSKRPEELDWLWRRPEERKYYDHLYATIDDLDLKDSVIFEPHGNDVPEWFRKVGYILSPSEFEGSHQSVAEGMAAGSVPVIRNWNGSMPLYPEKYNFSEVSKAVEIILKYTHDEIFRQESEAVKKYAQEHFDRSVILPEYDRLIHSLLN